MWMKVHYIQNTSTGLKYSNFTIIDQENILGKIKIIILRLRFRTQDLQALTHCAILLGKYFGKETNYEIIFDFIVYFDRKHVTIRWRYLVPPPE